MYYDIVTVMTFTPCLGVLVLFCLPRASVERVRGAALAFSLMPLVFFARILQGFQPTETAVQFAHKVPWIGTPDSFFHVEYFVGVDGLSIAMVLLVSILTPLTILGTLKWVGLPDTNRAGHKVFFSLILLEQTGLYGAFTALNFFHWFIFWEASLVPMFFLIKLYGNEDRTNAAYQFFVYTFVGSVAMMIGMQFIYWATQTWDFIELAKMARTLDGGETVFVARIKSFAMTLGVPFLMNHAVTLLFVLVFMGFAVKVPVWPFHTWLPVSYTQAPTAGSMLLTGLMSKMGVYGFLRIVLPLFGPTMAQHAKPLMFLAVATILFGALAAFVQRDLKRIIAYSSVNHLGYCMLGIFAVAVVGGTADDKALAINGVIFQMFAHGLSAVGLFYFAGLIERRTHTREIANLGGLRKTVPVMCGLMGITMFASLGLPGLCGFVGEFMIFRGAYPICTTWTSIAIVGILLTAFYLLRMTTVIFFGPQDDKWNGMADLSTGERIASGLLVVMMIGIGLIPGPLVQLSNAAALHLARFVS